jgi:hypothetical protein
MQDEKNEHVALMIRYQDGFLVIAVGAHQEKGVPPVELACVTQSIIDDPLRRDLEAAFNAWYERHDYVIKGRAILAAGEGWEPRRIGVVKKPPTES